ncbi:hypothetical protein GCK32_014901, partial [Trichostrongylus colubriformis]
LHMSSQRNLLVRSLKELKLLESYVKTKQYPNVFARASYVTRISPVSR